MDTRIILDYLRRWAWLWASVIACCLGGGFAPAREASFLLAMPLIYLVIPMSSELRKQGPAWLHRTLPVGDPVLIRTSWLLAVVVPMAAVVVSLLPALAFGWMTGYDNLAKTNLLPLISGGFLWTSVSFIMIALGGHIGRSKPLHVLIMAGTFLVAAAFLLLLMKSAQYWNLIPLRVGMMGGAMVLVPVSYLVAPQLLDTVVRNSSEPRTVRPGENRALYAESPWDRILSVPFGRTLVTGIWLLTFLFWMNLFYALLSGATEWWNIQAVFSIAPVGMQMMAMFLFLYAFIHVTSLRGMAMLPISRVRRTLIVTSLPLAAAIPFILTLAAQVTYMQATAAEMLTLAVMVLYCLVTAYACLAICLRFGFMPAIAGLMVFVFVVMIRVMNADRFGMPELSVLDGAAGLGLILLAGLWIHQVLDRHPDVYRRHWIPAGLRRR